MKQKYEMTPEQLRQWKDYGCVSRSLIKLATLDGNALSAAEFCERFEHLFPRPQDRYGILDDKAFNEIVRELGLSLSVRQEREFSKVREEFNKGKRVLAISAVDLSPGESGEINHCSVLMKIDEAGFSLWSPLQSGEDYSPDFVKDGWNEKKFCGLVLD